MTVDEDIETYLKLLSGNPMAVGNALRIIESEWQPGSLMMMLEATRLTRSREILEQVVWLAESRTGQSLGMDVRKWLKWNWNQEYAPHPKYSEFKSTLYSQIDPRFAEYFQSTGNARIRLDEIVWGGVRRDGIPPLKDPEMIAATEATWLEDSNVVFGVNLNGDARCYPKRILAWHEMFKDTIGGESVCGVY